MHFVKILALCVVVLALNDVLRLVSFFYTMFIVALSTMRACVLYEIKGGKKKVTLVGEVY